MRDGADVIVQARLQSGRWAGWADVLLRKDGESSLGAWLYEPVETKLARETRGTTSRARGLCILVGNPLLFEPECRTPEQIRWPTRSAAISSWRGSFAEISFCCGSALDDNLLGIEPPPPRVSLPPRAPARGGRLQRPDTSTDPN